MEIPNLIRDLLYDGSLDHLMKPDIVFGNYFFVWHEKSLGLYSKEITKFKHFIKKLIPYLETMMKIIDSSSSSTLHSKNDPMKKKIFDKGQFCLSDNYNNHIFFILNIDNDGSTTFFREERLLINDELYNKMKIEYDSTDIMILLNKLKEFDNMVSIKWKLGDLLFDRAGHK